VHTTIRQHRMHLLVAEFRSAKHTKSSGKELWNILVKLGNEMKDSRQDRKRWCTEECRGLRLVGRSATCSDLKYTAVYRMLRLGRFYVHRNRHDFGVLPAAIELLLQARNIITRSAELCVESFYSTLKDDGKAPPPDANNSRPSFHTPMKVPLRS